MHMFSGQLVLHFEATEYSFACPAGKSWASCSFWHNEIGKDITFTNRACPHGQIHPSYILIEATLEKM